MVKEIKRKNISKTIGIIGGMGPGASAYFYNLLIKKSELNFGARNNDDYPKILLSSVPVPDFISDTKNLEKAKTMLTSCIKELNDSGVSNIGMVCNTAHILYQDLVNYTKVNFVSMIEKTAESCSQKGYKKVGILSTPTTLKFKLYEKALSKFNIQSIDINHETLPIQEKIIREVIAGKINKKQGDVLEKITKKFIKEYKLDGVILGCTELPLVFPKERFTNIVDSLDVLAGELLRGYYL